MRCEKCKKNKASIHMEQLTSGTKKDIYLCDECSGEMEIKMLVESIFKGLFNKMHLVPVGVLKNIQSADSKLICTKCGVSLEDVKKSGNLGCAVCYKSFEAVFKPFFENLHGGSTHEGKYPKRGGATMERESQLHKLRFLMNQSVAEEDFEKAAFFRDEIKNLSAISAPVDDEEGKSEL